MGRKRRRTKSAGVADVAGADKSPEPATTLKDKSHTTKAPTTESPHGSSKKRKVEQNGRVSEPSPSASTNGNVNASVSQVPSDEAPKKKKKKKKTKNAAPVPGPVETAKKVVPKASTNAIDDLFASLKTAKKEQAEAVEKQKRDDAKAAQRAQQEKQQLQAHIKKLEAQNTNSIGQVGVNPDPRPVRYDDDGLPIYTEESLHINKGGDTADCPFDCWCCF